MATYIDVGWGKPTGWGMPGISDTLDKQCAGPGLAGLSLFLPWRPRWCCYSVADESSKPVVWFPHCNPALSSSWHCWTKIPTQVAVLILSAFISRVNDILFTFLSDPSIKAIKVSSPTCFCHLQRMVMCILSNLPKWPLPGTSCCIYWRLGEHSI